jgi:hypothetical protein
MIIKRIYFPGSIYSQNKAAFKNILTKYRLLWNKSAFQTYVGKDGRHIMSGIYYTDDQVHKILCIYEGDNKPTTFLYKTVGSGGNFLIDINSFCTGLGCIIDIKDEEYINNIILKLHDHESINILEEIKKEREKDKHKNNKKLEEFKINAFDLKLRGIVRKYIRRYIIDNGESLKRRGIGIKVALFFKKKDIQSNVRWGLENGWIK